MAEVPVHHYPRPAGRSQFFRFRAVVETLIQLVHLFFRKGVPRRAAALARKIPETTVE
jgi:hypothetical protein